MTRITKPIECLGTEDGEPWGVYLYGHVSKSKLTLEEVNAALDDAGFDPVSAVKVKHLWMRHFAADDEDGDEDYPWHWCKAGDPGAIAVTGVKYPYRTSIGKKGPQDE